MWLYVGFLFLMKSGKKPDSNVQKNHFYVGVLRYCCQTPEENKLLN